MNARRSTRAVWVVLAVLNLAAGAVLASRPERQSDFATVHGWVRGWVVDHNNVYDTGDSEQVDADAPVYPPHAIILLSPLGALPFERAVQSWVVLNLALAPLAAWLAIRVVRPRMALSEALLPMMIFLTWGGFRALLEFSLVPLVFGLLAMRLADKRPGLGGVALGLSLMKPHIALPFFLWAVFTKRWRIVAGSLAVVAGGTVLYLLSVGAGPFTLIERYVTTLRAVFLGGDSVLVGLAQIQPLVAMFVSDVRVADIIVLIVTVLLFVIIGVIGFQEGRRTREPRVSAPALTGIASLLLFYHLTYGFLLLLPTATLLLFLDDPVTLIFRRRLFWALQLFLMFDPVTIWRWFSPLLHLPPDAVWVANVDRVLMLALFGCVAALFHPRRVSDIITSDPHLRNT